MFEEMDERYAGMLRDESRVEGHAEAVARPGDMAQLMQAMGQAASQGLRLTVQGAATGVAGGAAPQGGVLLSTRGMGRILGLREEEGRFFLRAQAGLTLEQVEAYLRRPLPLAGFDEQSAAAANALRAASHFFPPNPTEKSATLGGAFACNAAGMNRTRYGRFSASVSALSWVTPAGDLWQLRRGQAVFDATSCPLPEGSHVPCPQGPSVIAAQFPHPGMDLIDFLAGSEGRLGLAVELELALLPAPKENWGVLLFFSQPQGAKGCAQSLPTLPGAADFLTGCEYLDGAVLDLLRGSRSNRFPAPPEDAQEALYIEFAGEDADALEECLAALLELFLEQGGKEADAWAADSLPEMEKFRALCHAAPELVNGEIDRARGRKRALDLQSREIWALLELCRREAGQAGVPVFCFGHVLEGQAHVNLVPQSSAQRAQCGPLLERWAARAVERGGLLAAENGVGKLQKTLVWQLLPPAQRAYYMELQRIFDPLGVMQNGFDGTEEHYIL